MANYLSGWPTKSVEDLVRTARKLRRTPYGAKAVADFYAAIDALDDKPSCRQTADDYQQLKARVDAWTVWQERAEPEVKHLKARVDELKDEMSTRRSISSTHTATFGLHRERIEKLEADRGCISEKWIQCIEKLEAHTEQLRNSLCGPVQWDTERGIANDTPDVEAAIARNKTAPRCPLPEDRALEDAIIALIAKRKEGTEKCAHS